MDHSFVPGLPMKIGDVCFNPTQEPTPHVLKSYVIEDGKIKDDGFKANTEDYPEFAFIVKQFIDNI